MFRMFHSSQSSKVFNKIVQKIFVRKSLTQPSFIFEIKEVEAANNVGTCDNEN